MGTRARRTGSGQEGSRNHAKEQTPSELVLAVRKLTHQRGVFTVPEIKQKLGDPSYRISPSQGPLKKALEAGEVVAFRAGNRTTYSAVVARNLSDILVRAEHCVDDDRANTCRGSRGAGLRCVMWLSNPQFERAHTVARGLATYKKQNQPGSYRDLDAQSDYLEILKGVSGADLHWFPDAGKGNRGAWTGIERMVESAFSHLKPNTVHAYKGTMANVMFLAASRGWIAVPAADEPRDSLPASWSGIWNKWRDALKGADALRAHGTAMGLRWLFLGLDHLGYASPELTHDEWATAIPELERFFTERDLPSRRKSYARGVQRSLVRLELISAPEWDGRDFQNDGVNIFANDLIHTIALAYGSERDWHDAVEDRERSLRSIPQGLAGLKHQKYGLPAVLTYYCVPYPEAASWEVPSRGVGSQVPNVVNQGKVTGLATSTILSYLSQFGRFLGLWTQAFGTDWSRRDLRALCDPERVEQLFHQIVKEKLMPAKSLATTLRVTSRVLSPLITNTAKADRVEALERGDEKRVNELNAVIHRAEHVVTMLSARQFERSNGQAPEEGLIQRLTRRRPGKEARVRRQVEAAFTSGVYRGRRLDTSYEAIALARWTIERRLLQQLGFDSWSALTIAIESGHRVDLNSAVAIRDALMIGFEQVIPFRRAALAGLKLGWLNVRGVTCTVAIRVYLIKGDAEDKSDHSDTDRRSEWEYFNLLSETPDPPNSQMLDPALLQAHNMPGGAREVLLDSLGIAASPYLWIPERWNADDLARGELPHAPRLRPRPLSDRFSLFNEEAGKILGIDSTRLAQVPQLHGFRHSFATFFVNRGMERMVRLYLSHAPTSTLDLYANDDPTIYHPGREGARFLSDAGVEVPPTARS